MAKNNIRSIRFSDELAELIDRQVGNTFTEKFENLITKCVWELPQKEKRIKNLNKEIARKIEQLSQANQRYTIMLKQLRELDSKMMALEHAVSISLKEWENKL